MTLPRWGRIKKEQKKEKELIKTRAKVLNQLKTVKSFARTYGFVLSFLSTLFVFSSASVADPNIASDANSADCKNSTLETYSGTSNLSANWEANTIHLHWYDGNTELTVPSESQSCVYDGDLTPPATIPTRTGYTFTGWKVRDLPHGYTKMQYIQSSGSQSINTGYVVKETDSIEVDYTLTNLSASGDKFIIVGGNLWAETYGSANQWYVRFGSSSSVNTSFNSSQTSGTFVLKKQSFSVNGTQILQPAYNSTLSSTLQIFGRKNSATAVQGAYIRISAVRIKNGNNLVHNYIACRRDSDNELGLCDTITRSFLANSGLGFFTGVVAQ